MSKTVKFSSKYVNELTPKHALFRSLKVYEIFPENLSQHNVSAVIGLAIQRQLVVYRDLIESFTFTEDYCKPLNNPPGNNTMQMIISDFTRSSVAGEACREGVLTLLFNGLPPKVRQEKL
jgi:hypothetical protein